MLIGETADDVHRLLKAENYCGVVSGMLPLGRISKFIETFQARTSRKHYEIKAMIDRNKEVSARRRAFLKKKSTAVMPFSKRKKNNRLASSRNCTSG